jgi:PAS domain-containing protein
MAQQKLDEALEQLESAEPIFRRGTRPDAEYTFKQKVEAQTVHRYKIGDHAVEHRLDGSYCWVSDEWYLIRDESGEPVEIVGSWSDITVRKQALEESDALVKQAQVLVSDAIESMSDGFALWDKDDRLVMCSRRSSSRRPEFGAAYTGFTHGKRTHSFGSFPSR